MVLRLVHLLTGHTSKRARVESGKECSTSQAGGASHLERELERSLREFVRLRTVSSDPTLREECFRGAKYLANLLESIGEAYLTFSQVYDAVATWPICWTS